MKRRRQKGTTARPKRRKRSVLGRVLGGLKLLIGLPVAFLLLCTLHLAALNVVPPGVTSVQMQRQVEAWLSGTHLSLRYDWVPRSRIAGHLGHAVIAAEDGRFYSHNGIDWEAVQDAIEEHQRRGRLRGASTITQQLVKNLYLTTHSSWIRKGFEFPLAYIADFVLPKDRILELYLNVVEFGPGVFGAEAAAQYHYDKGAATLTRNQAARLAAILPAPRTRRPERMGWYASIIQRRMAQHGW